jgi:propanol-preferring alcohol dehydrogenase
LLWGERHVLSVANLTRKDADDFFAAAAGQVRTTTTEYPLEAANDALASLRAGQVRGAAVLRC